MHESSYTCRYELVKLEKYKAKKDLLDAIGTAEAVIVRSDVIDPEATACWIFLANYTTTINFDLALLGYVSWFVSQCCTCRSLCGILRYLLSGLCAASRSSRLCNPLRREANAIEMLASVHPCYRETTHSELCVELYAACRRQKFHSRCSSIWILQSCDTFSIDFERGWRSGSAGMVGQNDK